MATSLTAIQQAQEWFSLEWYQDAERFDAMDWAKQITKRAVIKYAFSAGEAAKKTLDFLMEDLIAEPLGCSRSLPYSNTSETVASLPYATGPVVPLAHHDFDRLNTLRNAFSWHSDLGIDEWSRQYEQLFPLTRFGHLKVDMNARDDEILTAFKNWLPKYRDLVGTVRTKPYRNSRDAEMQNWHEKKILPYFDLMSWKQWKSIRLTELDIIELLFTDAQSRNRDVLRSIRTKADEVITLENAIALSVA